MQDFKFHKTGVKAGVKLDQYKETYSIVSGYEGQDGKIGLDWVRAYRWDKATKQKVQNDKDTPAKVYLGERETAVKVLEAMLNELTGQGNGSNSTPVQEETESDIPF